MLVYFKIIIAYPCFKVKERRAFCKIYLRCLINEFGRGKIRI